MYPCIPLAKSLSADASKAGVRNANESLNEGRQGGWRLMCIIACATSIDLSFPCPPYQAASCPASLQTSPEQP